MRSIAWYFPREDQWESFLTWSEQLQTFFFFTVISTSMDQTPSALISNEVFNFVLSVLPVTVALNSPPPRSCESSGFKNPREMCFGPKKSSYFLFNRATKCKLNRNIRYLPQREYSRPSEFSIEETKNRKRRTTSRKRGEKRRSRGYGILQRCSSSLNVSFHSVKSFSS